MELPISRKANILVRSVMRFTCPWLFGRIIVDKDSVTLKYFFITKRIAKKDISNVKVFDNMVLQFSYGKASYQVRISEANEIAEHLKSKD